MLMDYLKRCEEINVRQMGIYFKEGFFFDFIGQTIIG